MQNSDPISALLENVDCPLDTARAMPPSVYTSEKFLQSELSEIFSKEWICVGRSNSLPNLGDYLTYELAGQPILVIRDKDNTLRAMSNVCLHRMSTILEGTGNKPVISCPYHGWTYRLNGSLIGAAMMEQNQGFCKSNYKLPSIRCEEWLGWIMVSLNHDAPSVVDQLSEIEDMIADYKMENYVQTFYEEHTWNTNWKILAENFMESYHLPVCHAGTIGGLSKLSEMNCPLGLKSGNYHTILKDKAFTIAQAHPDNTRLLGERRQTTYLLTIYPSLLITLTPGYFWYLSLHPQGVGKVRISFGGGMAPEFVGTPETKQILSELKTLLDDVNLEDRTCTERVYKGLSANLARPGHLSHLERPNFEFAQYLADKTGGFHRSFSQ